jgi:hypothetical protein
VKIKWEHFKKWALDHPLLRASTAFVAFEGLFESIFIIAAGIAYITTGNYAMALLFGIWALWEIFARAIVVKQVI